MSIGGFDGLTTGGVEVEVRLPGAPLSVVVAGGVIDAKGFTTFTMRVEVA